MIWSIPSSRRCPFLTMTARTCQPVPVDHAAQRGLQHGLRRPGGGPSPTSPAMDTTSLAGCGTRMTRCSAMEAGVHLPQVDVAGEGLSSHRLLRVMARARDAGFVAVSANDHFSFTR